MATMLLNGCVLQNPRMRDKLLTINPTWVELMRIRNIGIESFDKTRDSIEMYKWVVENDGDVVMRVTTTVELELMKFETYPY